MLPALGQGGVKLRLKVNNGPGGPVMRGLSGGRGQARDALGSGRSRDAAAAVASCAQAAAGHGGGGSPGAGAAHASDAWASAGGIGQASDAAATATSGQDGSGSTLDGVAFTMSTPAGGMQGTYMAELAPRAVPATVIPITCVGGSFPLPGPF